MKKSWGWLVIVVITALGAATGPVSADRPGSSAGQFLMLGPGGRPAALGNAYTAVADGVNALYWNPAGLGRLDGSELTFMHSRWFQDVSYNYAAFAWEEPVFDGHLAGGATLLDYGEINITRINGQNPVTGLGKTDANDYAITAGYGREWDWFDWGVAVKYIHQQIASSQDDAFACDLGLLFNQSPLPHVRFGASLLNLGTKIRMQSQSYQLPLTFKVGAAFQAPTLPLLLTADCIVPTDDRVVGAVGLEYTIAQLLALRAGYNTEQDAGNGWSVGAGFNPNPDFSVDYAFVPYGDLGDAHRISLDYRFGISGGREIPPRAAAARTASSPPPSPASSAGGEAIRYNQTAQDLLFRGMEQYRERRYDLAAQNFIAAFQLEPRNPTVAYNLASTYYAAGAYDHAEEWFRYYTTLAPSDANGFVSLGLALDRNGRADEAVAAWRRALELDPENQVARSRLAGGKY